MSTQKTTISPFARPLYVMLKPAGASCNLRCDYCYYLDKKELYPGAGSMQMSDATLENFIVQYLGAQTQPEVMFTWHGGETLLRDRAFYEKALELQRKHARGRRIDNSIQTNGTLLTDDWCKFFKDNNFLVGISVDGPGPLHDRYRRTAAGGPTFDKVMQGVFLLKKHGVEFNIMGVVNDYNADYPLEFYNFFKAIDCRYIQFAPIVETIDGKPAPWNVSSRKWGNFLIKIFDQWVRNDVGQFFIQYFDATLANVMGVAPGVCIHARTCGHAGVMEFNGDVYSCDHFVFPEYKLGNIASSTLADMMYSQRQADFGDAKFTSLPGKCRRCRHLSLCWGECPKNRISATADGEPGLNYLCEGYYRFFDHVAPYMNFMASELHNKRPPSNIMATFKKQ